MANRYCSVVQVIVSPGILASTIDMFECLWMRGAMLIYHGGEKTSMGGARRCALKWVQVRYFWSNCLRSAGNSVSLMNPVVLAHSAWVWLCVRGFTFDTHVYNTCYRVTKHWSPYCKKGIRWTYSRYITDAIERWHYNILILLKIGITKSHTYKFEYSLGILIVSTLIVGS